MPRDDSVDRSLEVLVVDDDPDVRELLEEFFREMEFVVATAKDGRAAISAVQAPDRLAGALPCSPCAPWCSPSEALSASSPGPGCGPRRT